jgi:antitoxin (DNA-binding transcriptional repressor) of toxin-antitoxin stability system
MLSVRDGRAHGEPGTGALAELIDSTQRSGEPVVLTRHGRPVAVAAALGFLLCSAPMKLAGQGT